MTEKDTGIECPKCGRKIIDGGTDYKCEAGDFMCKKNMRGHEITLASSTLLPKTDTTTRAFWY